jgi:hypothetical protein
MRPVPQARVRDGFELLPDHCLNALEQRVVHQTLRLHLIVGGAIGGVAFLNRKGGEVLLIKRRCFHGWFVLSCCACLRRGLAP